MAIREEEWQNLSTVQSPLAQKPNTIVAAATIAPNTFLTVVSGTTQLVTITPPYSDRVHMLCFLFPDAMGAFATSGNIAVAADPGVNIPVFMVYNPLTAKYYPGPIS